MSKAYVDHLFNSLPAKYREEGISGFTYRFLGLFAAELEITEDLVYGFHRQLDPALADEEFLDWLATLVDFELDANWPAAKRRSLIQSAVDLYLWRGTIYGIQRYVEIYVGIVPGILEFLNMGWRIGIKSTIGMDTKIYNAATDAHCFSLIVKSEEALSSEQKETVTRIVEIQKPAHTKVVHYAWLVVSPWQVEVSSTIEVDTFVGG